MTLDPVVTALFDPFSLSHDSSFLSEADMAQNPFNGIPWALEVCESSKRSFFKSKWNQIEDGIFRHVFFLTCRSPWATQTNVEANNTFEVAANELFQSYVSLYYEGPNALCSFFITSTEENCWNFVILIQNSIEDHQEKDDIEPVISSISSWNAVHKGGVEFNESSQTYAYKLHSSVVVRSRKIPSKADTNDASGFPNWSLAALYDSSHLKHIGMLLESSESKLRLSIFDVHSQEPITALKSAFKFPSQSISPKAMNLACQSEFLRRVQSRDASE